MQIDSSKSLLVVDDFEPMRKTVKNILNTMGYTRVAMANNGNQAISYLTANPVDCIISDWNMPGATGLDLLDHVRSQKNLDNIPFMLVTAEVERDKVTAAIKSGVSEFLIKPFTPIALREKVDWMLTHPAHKKIDRQARVSIEEEPAVVVKPSKPQRATVLVVDDLPTNIDVIAGILKERYQVKVAMSGEKALEVINSSPPDLVLLDIMMPDMDGYEVCRRLKSNPETADIPVIFLTAKSEIEDITSGFELGCVDYLTKPANPAVLKARVNTHLQLKFSRDRLKDEMEMLIENIQLREDVERMTRHDLKNPLSAIINSSEMLLENKTFMGGMEQRGEIEGIRDASYNILAMINKSLDLYKMETGSYQLQPESFDISATVEKVVNESRTNAQAFGISIFFEAFEPCFALAEVLLCYSMLSNLIKNAVEASPKKGKVKVEIINADVITVAIHNQSAIPEEIRNHFFDKYATSGKQGGTGLGTYSAQLMAKAQGGGIAFETSDTDGTTISVTLPKAPDE
jgi:two-component system sensor histidine kinase/response regulator